MTTDAQAVLHKAELGEEATWSDGTTTRRLTVRFVDQGERQTVRRASVFTIATGLPGSAAGDTFTIRRHGSSFTYRLMYSDRAETALQRHVCHEQLTSMFKFIDRQFYKSSSGIDAWYHGETSSEYRGKINRIEASNVRASGNRKMRSTFHLYMETLPTLTTDKIVLDSDGRGYRIVSVERPVERVDLPYLIVTRSDA